MTAKLAFVLLLSTLITPLLRKHNNKADQSGPIRQRKAWIPIDSAHTDASWKSVLVTSFVVLTLRTIVNAEKWHLENDKPNGHSCMGEHHKSEWGSSKLTTRCARVSSYFPYFGTSQPNTSSHWSYNEGSEAKIRIFYFPFCEIFIDRNDSVNVIGLDYNLIQVLVMPISTYDYCNIS